MTRLRSLLARPEARILGTLLALGLLALLLVRLARLWREQPVPLGEADPVLLALALLASGLAMTAFALVWGVALRAVGIPPPRGLLAAFYAGQLGKYVPGSAWQYAGRAGLLLRLGVPLRPGAASLALEALCSLLAAALVAPFALAAGGPRLAAVAAAVALVAAAGLAAARTRAARRAVHRALRLLAGVDAALDLRALRVATARYVLVWLAFGVALWLTARALYAVPVSELLLYAGAYAAAWATGFVVVLAPGGIGVREAVLVVLLRDRLGESEAIVLAAASRIAFTLVDLAGGAAALALLRAYRPAGSRRL